MSEEKEEVTVTDPDGTELPKEEADKFIRKLQQGVFYIPQRRGGA